MIRGTSKVFVAKGDFAGDGGGIGDSPRIQSSDLSWPNQGLNLPGGVARTLRVGAGKRDE